MSFRYQIQFVQGSETGTNPSVFPSISPCFLSYGIKKIWDSETMDAYSVDLKSSPVTQGWTCSDTIHSLPSGQLREILAVVHYSREIL